MTHPAIFQSDLNTLQAHRIVGEACRYYQQHQCWDLFQGNVSELKQAHKQIKLRALQQAKALCEIHDILSAQMPVLHFKGLTLSHLLYNDIAVRTCRDIDILIPQESRQQAHEMMLSLGYRCPSINKNYSAAQLDYSWRIAKDCTYIHPQTTTCVEVHGRLFASQQHLPLNLNAVWNCNKTISVFGRKLSILNAQHYCSYLILHGSRSAYYRHHWLCDLHQYCLQHTIDWQSITDTFIQSNCESILLYSMQQLNSMFTFPIPKPIKALNSKKTQRRTTKLITTSQRILYGMHHQITKESSRQQKNLIRFKSLNTVLHQQSLKKSWKYKINCYRNGFLLAELFPHLQLPTKLFWLYEVLKPFFFIYLRFVKRDKTADS